MRRASTVTTATIILWLLTSFAIASCSVWSGSLTPLPAPSKPASTAEAQRDATAPDPSLAATVAATTVPATPLATQTASDSVGATAETGIAPEPTLPERPAASDASPEPRTPTPLPVPTLPARSKTVALDPGHGGPEVGAAATGLAEKDLNLRIALKLASLLRERGIAAILTRETDRAVSPDYIVAGYPGVSRDLQARVDVANSAGADLFISIHNNGSADSSASGTEVWYSSERSFAEQNLRFARLAQAALVKDISALGYPVVDRGIKDDSNFRTYRGRVFNLFVLGPGTGARPHVPTAMPGILGETLFLSNPGDAARLRQESTLDAIAAGYRDAVAEFFADVG